MLTGPSLVTVDDNACPVIPVHPLPPAVALLSRLSTKLTPNLELKEKATVADVSRG